MVLTASAGCIAPALAQVAPPPAVAKPDPASTLQPTPYVAKPALAVKPKADAVMQSLRRVADWQLSHRDYLYNRPKPKTNTDRVRDWQQGTFWVGLTELANRDPRYVAPIMAVGNTEGWRMGNWAYFADDQLIGQVWDWAYRKGAGPEALAPAKAYYDNLFANRPTDDLKFVTTPRPDGQYPCTRRWCWADALFMGPATMLRLGQSLKDKRYADYVHEEFKASTDYLYDAEEDLYFRDSRYFEQRDDKGRKLFWGRGNGWVLAGIARVIETLPAGDPKRAYYIGIYRKMADRLVKLQKSDGYWAASLLDDGQTLPETSGTGFITYGIAWGVNNGLLKGAKYESAALRGWQAMENAVQPDGMVGWVQQVGEKPGKTYQLDTQWFGTGAYLLAGSAIYDLSRTRKW